jgi:hypothetical protein
MHARVDKQSTIVVDPGPEVEVTIGPNYAQPIGFDPGKPSFQAFVREFHLMAPERDHVSVIQAQGITGRTIERPTPMGQSVDHDPFGRKQVASI